MNREKINDSSRWQEVKRLFDECLQLPPQRRAAFLADACKDDTALRTEVESLIDSDARQDDFIQPPTAQALSRSLHKAEAANLIDQRVGAYRVTRFIASGGMGDIYLAERADQLYEQQVAVKLLRRELLGSEMLRRFHNERQALADLQHPYIARLLDGGITQHGRPFLVMEYVEGDRIDGYCNAHKLTVRQRLELFLKVCEAVQYAHRQLIVHRDLKPGNILVQPDGTPRLLDFGIAKVLDSDITRQPAHVTQTMRPPLTPDYASPEQLQGGPISTACDIYSLGIVLYELLVGRHPYPLSGRTYADITQIVCEQPVDRPSTAVMRLPNSITAPGTDEITRLSVSQVRRTTPDKLRRDLRGDLDTIVMMTLRKEPERRYQSVEQLSSDVRRYLDGFPVLAQNDSWHYRLTKFVGRNRTAVVAAVLVLLTLLAGIAGVSWQAHEAGMQRDAARKNLAHAETVSEFLVGLFELSNPATAQGETITARQILDQGARKIREELQNEPDTQAMLMNTMGDVYMNLGLYEPAYELLTEALGIRRRIAGPDSLDIAESLSTLATLRTTMGDLDEAESNVREALRIREKADGHEHPEVARYLNTLGHILSQKGDYTAAEQILREGLRIRLELLGEEHPDVALSRNNLAGVLYATGDYHGAELLLHQALASARANYEPPHPELARRINNLAFVLHAQEKFDQAETLYLEALQMNRILLGDEHPQVAITLNNLGGLALEKGDAAGAEQRFREVLERHRAAHGEEHQLVSLSLSNLGFALLRQQQFEKAEPLLRDSLAMNRRLLPDTHPQIAQSSGRLVELLIETNRAAEALPLAEESVQISEQALPAGHSLITDSHCNLARCLAVLDRHEQIEAFLEEKYPTLQTGDSTARAAARPVLEVLITACNNTTHADTYRALLGSN